jgi:succinate dehydrogenase / fumarate reductase cytochrome b subunit
MKLLQLIFGSSLGRKYIMALTGVALIIFVIGHLVGNLQVFLGPEVINRYGAFLQANVKFLWVARIGLLAAVGLHIWSAIALTLENRAARPKAYDEKKFIKASYASRTMAVSGLIVLAFIIYHLCHYTFMITHPEYQYLEYTLQDGSSVHDIYSMIVLGFSQPLISGFYILAIGLLCLHLSHGIASMFQSLGLNTSKTQPCFTNLARGLSFLIFLGYASIPAAVLLGYLVFERGC